MKRTAPDGRLTVQPPDRAALLSWLEENHATSTGRLRLEYEEIVEEAVCFGWIDSKPNKLDNERTMLWLDPVGRRVPGLARTRNAWNGCWPQD